VNIRDVEALWEHFPEAPLWVTRRDWSLAEARRAMIKRRLLFPATTPLNAEAALARELFRIMKHGGTK
jgi:hypothetical protein